MNFSTKFAKVQKEEREKLFALGFHPLPPSLFFNFFLTNRRGGNQAPVPLLRKEPWTLSSSSR